MGGMRCKVPRAPVAAWLASQRVEAPRSPSWYGKCGANVTRGGPHWHSDETKTGCSPMVVPPSQLCLEFYNGHFVDPCLEKRFPCKGSQPGLLRLPCPMLPLFLALYCSSAFAFVVLYKWSYMCVAWSVFAGEAAVHVSLWGDGGDQRWGSWGARTDCSASLRTSRRRVGSVPSGMGMPRLTHSDTHTIHGRRVGRKRDVHEKWGYGGHDATRYECRIRGSVVSSTHLWRAARTASSLIPA